MRSGPFSPVEGPLVEKRYSPPLPGKCRPDSRNPSGQNPGVRVRDFVPWSKGVWVEAVGAMGPSDSGVVLFA
jgi:hypothetical protein